MRIAGALAGIALLAVAAGCAPTTENTTEETLAMKLAWDAQSPAERAQMCAFYKSDRDKFVDLYAKITEAPAATVRAFYKVECDW